MATTGRSRTYRMKDINFVAFPVLAAIYVEAGTVRELSHRLHLPQTSIRRRIKQLKEQNLIAQRIDKRWIPLVSIRMERVPEVPAHPEEKIQPGEPTGPVIIAPPDVEVEEPEPDETLAPVPTAVTPPLPKRTFKVDPSNKVSAHFRVPGKNEHGIATTGALAHCACGKPTPLKYGGIPICPICAREGK